MMKEQGLIHFKFGYGKGWKKLLGQTRKKCGSARSAGRETSISDKNGRKGNGYEEEYWRSFMRRNSVVL